MTAWTSDELTKISAVDELEVASLRQDGTLRKPRTIWVVRLGDTLYARSVHGATADWYRGAQERHEGHIAAGGVERDVTFVDVGHDHQAEIDAAYRAKYRRYARSIVDSTLTPQAQATTIAFIPRP